ncbi:unnamed protein product, partial [Rotaria magnacalcarata]
MELKSFFASQLSKSLHLRNTSSPTGFSFWAKCKRYLKASSSSLHGFTTTPGQITRDPKEMCEIAADFYEEFFKQSNIIRPHPYTDCPLIEFENKDEPIPGVTIEKLATTVKAKRKTKSLDVHGISNFMLNFIGDNHWTLLLELYNFSFQNSIVPQAWKDT